MSKDFDKYKLIYQFNNNSPLFVRIAQNHIDNLEFEEAIKILDHGLKNYPGYISALFLYSICLAELKRFNEAKEIVSKAASLLDSEESLDYYIKKISEIEIKNGISNVSDNEENSEITLTENNISDGIPDAEDELESLAKKLENAKLDINIDNELIDEFNPEEGNQGEIESGKSLVSETLAKIYLNQENYEEALSLYKNLVEIQPERSQFYLSQINYIQKIIESNQK